MLDPGRGAVLDRVEHEPGRNDDGGQVHLSPRIEHALPHPAAEDLAAPGVHRHYPPLNAARHQVLDYLVADLALAGRGADNRHGARLEQ